MCLVVFAWQVHPKFPLVIAANRDELHSRPTQALHWWADEPTLLGGRDLQAGGTWFSVARNGRIATVTNYRESHTRQSSRRSRGELVTQFLTGEKSPNDYASNIPIDNYAGFNLLVADQNELCYLSNRGDAPKTLEPGIYGLSNASLDTPWWKLEQTRTTLEKLIAGNRVNETTLLRMMANKEKAPVDDVPAGPLPFEIGRALTAPFIVTPEYGTRCTSILLRHQNGQIAVTERRFDARGKSTGDSRFSFVER
ncbi:MAG: NRDE family protein [Woeseia sp.]|jgi:uncharacterized protein with NRDE domain|nr:NRDE family protein [Woeseia sp.]MBT6210287.1 NRDE family protein [Woeseia sp.]